MNVAVLAAILAHTGLLAWPEARGCGTLPSIEADRSRVDAWLGLIGARFVALDVDRDGGGVVGVNHPRLIGVQK